LIQLLNDRDYNVRIVAVQSLGALGIWVKAAKVDLKNLINDPNLGALVRESLKKIETR
jgi:hypothetical protein